MPGTFTLDPPCPCGSARRLAACCGSPAGGDYTEAERNAATDRLLSFSTHGEVAAALRRAAREFWPEPHEAEAARRNEAIIAEQGQLVLASYLVYDHVLRDGTTVVQRLLRRERDSLPPRQRGYLAQAAAQPTSLYEVDEVFAEQGLRLRDVLRLGAVRVRERSATQQLSPGDHLIVRVYAEPDGTPVIEMPVLHFPAAAEPEIETWLLRQRGALRSADQGLALDPRPLRQALHHLWLDTMLQRSLPKLVNHDQEELVMCTSAFAVDDPDALTAALGSRDDFESDGDSWVWFRPLAGETRRLLGRLRLQGTRATLATNSRERAARGRELLEQIGGGALRFVAIAEEDGQVLLQRARADAAAGKGKPSEAPDPARRQALVRDALEQHFRAWVEQPLPAFGDRTPRELAKTEPQRVARMLWQIENNPQPEMRYDASWIYAELGLQRLGAGPFTSGVEGG